MGEGAGPALLDSWERGFEDVYGEAGHGDALWGRCGISVDIGSSIPLPASTSPPIVFLAAIVP